MKSRSPSQGPVPVPVRRVELQVPGEVRGKWRWFRCHSLTRKMSTSRQSEDKLLASDLRVGWNTDLLNLSPRTVLRSRIFQGHHHLQSKLKCTIQIHSSCTLLTYACRSSNTWILHSLRLPGRLRGDLQWNVLPCLLSSTWKKHKESNEALAWSAGCVVDWLCSEVLDWRLLLLLEGTKQMRGLVKVCQPEALGRNHSPFQWIEKGKAHKTFIKCLKTI